MCVSQTQRYHHRINSHLWDVLMELHLPTLAQVPSLHGSLPLTHELVLLMILLSMASSGRNPNSSIDIGLRAHRSHNIGVERRCCTVSSCSNLLFLYCLQEHLCAVVQAQVHPTAIFVALWWVSCSRCGLLHHLWSLFFDDTYKAPPCTACDCSCSGGCHAHRLGNAFSCTTSARLNFSVCKVVTSAWFYYEIFYHTPTARNRAVHI